MSNSIRIILFLHNYLILLIFLLFAGILTVLIIGALYFLARQNPESEKLSVTTLDEFRPDFFKIYNHLKKKNYSIFKNISTRHFSSTEEGYSSDNLRITEFLESTVNNTVSKNKPPKTNSKDRSLSKNAVKAYSDSKVNSSEFTKATLKELDPKTNSTYHTLRFEKELASVLGSPEDFQKKNSYDRKQVQKAVKKLGIFESEWKYRSVTLFPKGFREFNRKMNKYIYPSQKKLGSSQRAKNNYFLYKVERILKGFCTLLSNLNHAVFKHILDFEEEDFKKIIDGFIKKKWIFNDFMRIVLKKASDNIFNDYIRKTNKYHDMLTENTLVVDRQSVFFDYQNILPLYFLAAALDYLKAVKIPDLILSDLLNIARDTLYYKKHLYLRKTSKSSTHILDQWWGENLNNTATIMLIFEETEGLFQKFCPEQNDDKKKNGRKMVLKYVLPSFLDDKHCLRGVLMPDLTRPDPVTPENINRMIKHLKFGDNKLSISPEICDTLTKAQNRRFKINPLFVCIFESILTRKHGNTLTSVLKKKDYKFPFPSREEIQNLESLSDYFIQNPISSETARYCLSKLRGTLASVGIALKNNAQTQAIVGSSHLEVAYNSKENNTLKQKTQVCLKYKHAQTCLNVSKLLEGFPLFIKNSMDVRGRLYPNFTLLARTSGIMKHFLCEFTPKTINTSGLINLMGAYFKASDDKFRKFQEFVKQLKISKRTFAKKMFEFFHKNYIDFSKSGVPLYFMLLHAELLTVERTKKTAVNLEIDQTASGVVFLAFLTKNKKLADVANIISQKNTCPYTHCLKNFKNFYQNHMKSRSPRFLKLATTDRKLHKYALMCFCYNQTHMGRIDDFKTRWFDKYKEWPKGEDFKCLQEFATNYPKFLNTLFPNIVRQFQLLEEMVSLLIKESSTVSIKTLEGEILQWSFYKTETQIRSAFNPTTSQFYNYANTYIVTKKAKELVSKKVKKKTRKVTSEDNHLLESETQNLPAESLDTNIPFFSQEELERHKGPKNERASIFVDDVMGARRKFLSFLVHSIDAAIIRRFIRIMGNKPYSYLINHLHDCVIIHPNYVDDFYKIVKDVYSSKELYNIMDTLVFEPFLQNISKEGRGELEEKISEYKSYCDDFKDDLGNFNPRFLYKFEN